MIKKLDKKEGKLHMIGALLMIGLLVLVPTLNMAGSTAEIESVSMENELVFSKTYEIPPPSIVDSPRGSYIEWDGIYILEEGLPRVPIYMSNILLPPGVVDYQVNIQGFQEISLSIDDEFELAGPRLVSSDPYPEIEIVSLIDEYDQFPGYIQGLSSKGSLRGFDVLTVSFYPYQFDLINNGLIYYESVTVDVYSKLNTDAQLNLYRGRDEDINRVANMVDNPEMITIYEQRFDGNVNRLLSDEIDYVVIAPESFEAGYEDFVTHKNILGYRTVFTSLEYIYAEYTGVDEPEQIRNYLIDMYENNGLSYALLGGSTDVVPDRRTWVAASASDSRLRQHIPNDLYYADMDGIWQKEGSDWGNVEHDEGDAYAEIYVGRIPATSSAQAASIMDKVMTYELLPVGYDTDTLYRATFYHRPLDSNTHAMDHADEELIPRLPDSWLDEVVKTTSAAVAIDEMDAGINIHNNFAHGDSSSFGGVYSSDMAGLTNDEYFLLYTQACNSGRWGTSSVLKHGMRNANGGPMATIGNTRYGLYYPYEPSVGENAMLNTEFFEHIFNNSVTRLGDAHYQSKEVFGAWISPPGPDESDPDPYGWKTMNSWRYIYFGLNLMGDPTLDLYTDYQGRLEPDYTDEVFAGEANVEVFTEPYAYVTIYRDDGIFENEQADSAGYVSIDLTIPSEGDMHISVTKTNYAPYVGLIEVDEFIPGEPPSIDITSPSGGESWTARTDEQITWITEDGDDDVDRINLWYSTNDGASWTSIATGIPDTGHYTWEIPNTPTEVGKIRARAIDVLGRTGEDVSTGNFEIIGIPPSPVSNLDVEHYGVDELDVVFEEDFTGVGAGTIPMGWSRTHTNWGVHINNEAGGESPELRFSDSPVATATFRCATSYFDTTGYTELDLVFRHRYVALFGSVTLKAQVSADNGPWEDVWSVPTSSSIAAQEVSLVLDETHGIGTDNYRLAWTFVGRSGDARRWLIDDISLSTYIESDGTEHNLVTWDKSDDDPDEVSHYNLYRSDSYDGPWDTHIASIPATGAANYSYVDEFKGTEDEVLWWYLVRTVGDIGLEDQNTFAVREPGETETFDIPLIAGGAAEGWNFVSFNLIPSSSSLETILGDIDGSYDRVMYYDASTGRWSSYMPGRATRYNNLNTWNHHMGIWIKVHSGATLTVEGSLPTATDISLHPGWNMVGLPSETSGNHGLPAGVDVVGYFDASASGNLAYSHTPGTFVFEAGKAYMIHNPTTSVLNWEVTY